MQKHDIIVVGSSAGGLKALLKLVTGLPPQLNASIFIMRHFPVDEHSCLSALLTNNGPLRATEAINGEPFIKNRIYIAPSDRQLLLGVHTMELEQPLSMNHFRPTIDALFVSAANTFSLRVIGVVLSGLMDDGAQGLLAIKMAGGISIVQKPNDAEFKSMPESALHLHPADYVLPAADMGVLLGPLVR